MYVFPATWSSEAPRRDRVMEQPLLKPCIVSPSSVFRVVIMRWRRRRLATAESTKGLEDTWPLGTEQRALPKRDIHKVSQLNICSEIYDGANYTLMGACFNSENIGVIPSECFPKLVVKHEALFSRKEEKLFSINTTAVTCPVTRVEIQTEESQIRLTRYLSRGVWMV